MKSIITFVSLLLLGHTYCAAQNNTSLKDKVQKATQAAVVNAGVEENNHTLDFLLEESVRNVVNGAEGTYHAEYHCKAYTLDEHWYILAGTCGNSVNGDIGHHDRDNYTRHHLKLLTYSGQDITYYKNEHILLIRDEKHLPGLYVNVLATSTPETLFSLTAKDYTAKINTSRFGFNAVRTRELKPKTIHDGVFSLRKGLLDLNGTATDPLFLIAPDQNTYLAGYNAAPMFYYFYDHPGQVRGDLSPKGIRSNTWFSLTKADLEFIKSTVKKYPEDWKRIKQRLFLDQTETPFFK